MELLVVIPFLRTIVCLHICEGKTKDVHILIAGSPCCEWCVFALHILCLTSTHTPISSGHPSQQQCTTGSGNRNAVSSGTKRITLLLAQIDGKAQCHAGRYDTCGSGKMRFLLHLHSLHTSPDWLHRHHSPPPERKSQAGASTAAFEEWIYILLWKQQKSTRCSSNFYDKIDLAL